MHLDPFLSFGWFEVEVLQQSNEKKEKFLTSKLFSKARALTYNVDTAHRHQS